MPDSATKVEIMGFMSQGLNIYILPFAAAPAVSSAESAWTQMFLTPMRKIPNITLKRSSDCKLWHLTDIMQYSSRNWKEENSSWHLEML